MIERLLGKGRNLRIFDPHIQLDRIYGSNKNFVMAAIPHIGRLLEPEMENVLNWATHLVIAQRPSAEYREKLERSSLPIVDLTRIEVRASQMAAT
jgi:GDP-mannose 6-dehydrogenase